MSRPADRPLRWLMLATHVPASGSGGGMVRYVVELATALAARPDVDLHVVCAPEARPFFSDLLGSGSVHDAPDLPVALRSVAEREGGPLLPVLSREWDVVHGTKHLLPRRSGGALRLLTVHDMQVLDRPRDFGRLKRMALRGPYLASLRAADALVCVSAATRERVRNWLPEVADRARVVHLASSPSLRSARPVPVEELVGRRFAVVVGDPSPRKNLSMLVELWPDVVAACPDALLVVVGPPSWGPAQLGPVQRLLEADQARLLGHRSDGELSWLYQHAAVALAPSELEGFGLPVVEAAGFGAHVIASDDPAMGEIAPPGVERVSLHDRQGWCSAIVAALRDGVAPPAGSPSGARDWHQVAEETVAAVRDA